MHCSKVGGGGWCKENSIQKNKHCYLIIFLHIQTEIVQLKYEN